jgi:hypothetical protein
MAERESAPAVDMISLLCIFGETYKPAHAAVRIPVVRLTLTDCRTPQNTRDGCLFQSPPNVIIEQRPGGRQAEGRRASSSFGIGAEFQRSLTSLRLKQRGLVRLQLGGTGLGFEPSRPDAHRLSIRTPMEKSTGPDLKCRLKITQFRGRLVMIRLWRARMSPPPPFRPPYETLTCV